MKIKWIIGVDEAGRGPLAGPVSAGVAMVPADFNWQQIPGVNDSKKLTEKKREEIFEIAKRLEKEGELTYTVSLVSAKVIDKIGIVPAIQQAMGRALKKTVINTTIYRSILKVCFDDVFVKLDGGLKAPKEFIHQETIIKGDAKEKVIGLASIMAKVTRDRYMVRIGASPQFAQYTFYKHKGYGTQDHRTAISKHGLSSEHRKTFCKNVKVLYGVCLTKHPINTSSENF